MAIYRGPGGSGDATDDAASAAELIVQKTAEATVAATNANASAASASASAASAATSAANASATASSVASSVAAAASSASAAADSATTATTKASEASTSASNAASSASAASTSATNAANSATAAANSASSASSSATNASNSASSASSSASAASSAASNAAISESNAASSASSASTSASNASTSATNAANSASNAASSATNASNSASAASSSASNAATSESNALTYKNAANTSATNAATSESNAATSATNAANSATNSANSATNAANSASAAATSATNAAASATTAAGYVPSLTGNAGKYLRTNGTSNYWDTVTDVNPATPTDDGLVYGKTDDDLGTWTGVITNSANYLYYESGSTYHISFSSTSPVGAAYAAGNIVPGQLIQINDGTNTIDYGVIISVSGVSTVYITTSLKPFGTSYIDLKYCNTMTLTGTSGGNAVIGFNTIDNVVNGSLNTVIGYNAGSSIVSGNNNIVIGYNADTSGNVSNEVTIGNTNITKTRIRGAILVGNASPSAGSSGQVLTSQGSSSEPLWTTPTTGTVTSVSMSVPTGLSVSGSPITSSGTLAVSLASGYSIPTTSSQTNWDTAYSDRLKWDGGATGLDAATGRTSLGLGTAATTASTDYATAAQGTKADTAYGWGNHASAGYLLSSTAASTYAPLTGTGTSGTWGISITGNAATVTNGLYSTGSYANPTWLTSLAGSKITGTIDGGTY